MGGIAKNVCQVGQVIRVLNFAIGLDYWPDVWTRVSVTIFAILAIICYRHHYVDLILSNSTNGSYAIGNVTGKHDVALKDESSRLVKECPNNVLIQL